MYGQHNHIPTSVGLQIYPSKFCTQQLATLYDSSDEQAFTSQSSHPENTYANTILTSMAEWGPYKVQESIF